MRIIDMDIHRVAAEVVALCKGDLTRLGRVPTRGAQLEDFTGKVLNRADHVVMKATGSAAMVVEFPAPSLDPVVAAGPRQVRMIAHAKSPVPEDEHLAIEWHLGQID